MTSLESVICELEWERLRHRMMKNHARTLLLHVATVVLMAVSRMPSR